METLNKYDKIIQQQNELFSAHCEANYYKSLHKKNVKIREKLQYNHDQEKLKLQKQYRKEIAQLENRIKNLEAKLSLRERQLFGKKGEKRSGIKNDAKEENSKRKRGGQLGSRPSFKREHPELPVKKEVHSIQDNELFCPCCRAPYMDMNTSEESNIIEIDVKPHIRKIKRKKYKRTCTCSSKSVIITAPPVEKVLHKSHLGNSVWVHLLMRKFWHGQPTHRSLQELRAFGLDLSSATITSGFLKLLPLLEKVSWKCVEKSLEEKHWHADETGWKVFEQTKDKVGKRWFLWIFRSFSTAVFSLNPSRSSKVIESFFREKGTGIISCDRYSAYTSYVANNKPRFLIAYCWAHVRRDFIAVLKDWPIHEEWAEDWINEIRNLYYLNRCRLESRENPKKLEASQNVLENGIKSIREKMDIQLQDETLAKPCVKVLKSLDRFWDGLTTFVQHHEIPMDNNTAERGIRGSVIGRKNYYGSGSIKSGQLTATLFTIIQTLLIWNINPQSWMSKFFDFMANDWNRNFEKWLPWNMPLDERKGLFMKRKAGYDPPRTQEC